MPPKMDRVAQELKDAGRRPYVIKRYGSVPIGTVGYINAVCELLHQANQMQVKIDHLIVSGGGGTHAGLCLGAKATNAGLKITGIAISRRTLTMDVEVAQLVNETAAYLGLELRMTPQEITVLYDYAGPGFALPYPEMVEAIKLVAQTEGLILDPIYTGKVMAGLIDLIQKDTFQKDDNLIFWHTGGIPALFAPEYRTLFT